MTSLFPRFLRSIIRRFSNVILTLVLLTAETQGVTPPLSNTSDTVPTADWKNIRSAHEAAQHRIREHGQSGHIAHNSGQRWSTRFDGRGFLVQPNGADWNWGLELTSYGFPRSKNTIAGVPEVTAEGQRLEYKWDEGALTEWFINDQRGLEHGFILARRPQGFDASRNDSLVFKMATRGGLRPNIASDTKGVHFQDATGASIVSYAGLKVWDADGKILPSRFDAAGTSSVRLLVDERAARYPITIDPIAQQAYLKASNSGENDQFGISVAISGDTAVVSAPFEDSGTTGVNTTPNEDAADSGAVYVFVRTSSGWTQQAYLKASNTGFRDLFGFSVAISGDTIVVGAPTEDSSTTGVNTTPNDDSDFAGAVYVFVRNAGVWAQQAYLKGGHSDANDLFGRSVAVSGDTIIVGADGDDSSTTGVNSTPNNTPDRYGAAYIFVRSAGSWTQQAYIKSSNPGVSDSFGISVAVSDDTVLIGADCEDSSTTGVNGTPNEAAERSGAAYVFVRNAGVWSQQAFLKASNTGERDGFGKAVALSGDTAVIGAEFEDSSTMTINGTPDEEASGSGAAYVFVRNANTWTQQAFLKANNNGGAFGGSVGISGDTVIVGARAEGSRTTGVNSIPDYSEGGASGSGAAYVFTRNASTWRQQAYLKASNTRFGDAFGRAVAASDDAVIVGADQEDSITTGVNSTPEYNGLIPFNSGAAYIFTLASGDPTPSLRVSRAGNDTVISYDRPKIPGNTPPIVQHSPSSLQNFTILPATEYIITLTEINPDESETITIRIFNDGSDSRFFKLITEP